MQSFIPKLEEKNQLQMIPQKLFLQFFLTTHPLYPVSPQPVAVKQIATIQSALKPNTASTDPVSSVSPVGSAGMELPWLASASLPLETQPP